MRLLVWAALWGALFIGLFTGLASYAFLYSTGLIAYFPDPHHQWYQWWVYLGERANPAVNAGLWWWSGIPAAAFLLFILGTLAYTRRWSVHRDIRPALRKVPPPDRMPAPTIPGATDNHGHADFANDAEMRDRWPAPRSRRPTLVVGELYDPRLVIGTYKPRDRRTWGPGGSAPLLYDDLRSKSGHTVRIGGSGSGKTEAIKHSIRSTWTSGVVALDPKQTLGRQLKADREAMGQRVIIITPDDASRCGTNVLGPIDPGSPLSDMHVDDIVESICGDTPEHSNDSTQFFTGAAKDVVRCLLSHIVAKGVCPPKVRSLRAMRNMIASSGSVFREYLQAIHDNSPSRRARQLAAMALTDTTASGDASTKGSNTTFQNIHMTAAQLTAWLSTECWADLVSGDSFECSDILSGTTDVFLALPFLSLTSEPAVARCLLSAFFNTLFQKLDPNRPPILFPLDEVAQLRQFRPIKVALTMGREYGAFLHLPYQARRQITDQLGTGGLGLIEENASWISYVGINNYDTAKEISDAIGHYPVVAVSESTNTGLQGRGLGLKSRSRGTTVTYSEMGRARIRPEEIIGLRDDAQIITGGPKPVICGLALDYRRRACEPRARSEGLNGRPRRATSNRHLASPIAGQPG